MNLVDTIRQQVTNLFERFITIEPIVNLLTVLVMVLFWIVLGMVVIRVVKLIVLKTESFQDKHSKQGITMRRLINNLIRALFFFWIALMILKELGIDVLPVLAGAGVLAFAIGFGAQELIKDLISGFFLILEKTFSIGDRVEIGGHSGNVLDIGLRRTKLKTWKGEIITINNGDIKTVVNTSVNPSIAIIDFNIDFRKDIKMFESQDFKQFVMDFADNHPEVISEGDQLVVQDLLGGHVTLRMTFTTNIRKHIGVQRDFMKALLKYAQEHGIDLEVPLVLEQDQLK